MQRVAFAKGVGHSPPGATRPRPAPLMAGAHLAPPCNAASCQHCRLLTKHAWRTPPAATCRHLASPPAAPPAAPLQTLQRNMRREKSAHLLLRGYLYGHTLTTLQFVKVRGRGRGHWRVGEWTTPRNVARTLRKAARPRCPTVLTTLLSHSYARGARCRWRFSPQASVYSYPWLPDATAIVAVVAEQGAGAAAAAPGAAP